MKKNSKELCFREWKSVNLTLYPKLHNELLSTYLFWIWSTNFVSDLCLVIHKSNFNNYKIVKNTSSMKQNNWTTKAQAAHGMKPSARGRLWSDWKVTEKETGNAQTWRMRRRFAAVFPVSNVLSHYPELYLTLNSAGGSEYESRLCHKTVLILLIASEGNWTWIFLANRNT